MDIEKLTPAELHDLQDKIEAELKTRQREQISEFRKLALEYAEEIGITPRELIDAAKIETAQIKNKSRSVAAKYANPENPVERWAGRGRKPSWVANHLEKGGLLDDLLIP